MTHIQDGLRCYVQGDLRGAAQAWLNALAQQPDSLEAQQLVDSLRAVRPDILPNAPAAHRATGDSEPWGGDSLTEPLSLTSTGPGVAVLAPVVRSPGEAVAPELRAQSSAPQVLLMQGRLRDLLLLHDFTGALAVAERILSVAPGYAPALRARHVCTETLVKMYASKLQNLRAVPQTLVRAEDVPWLDLDPRTGFVLSQVDGIANFEEIRNTCNMSSLDVFRILAKLVADKVIGVVAPVNL